MKISKYSGRIINRKVETIFVSTLNPECIITDDMRTIIGANNKEDDGTTTSFHVEFSMAEIDYIKEQLDKHYQERLAQ